jgi:dihydrofolate reductase
MQKQLSIIVAIAEDNAIGNKNQLLAHIPADLKRFKAITTGKPVIMGRNTWFSLPNRPLPNRTNIVITNIANEVFEGAVTAYTIDEAVAKCPESEECFIIGGAMIYRQFFPLAQKLYLTLVHKKFEADTFFPEIDYALYNVLEHTEVNDDPKTDFTYTYLTLERKKK